MSDTYNFKFEYMYGDSFHNVIMSVLVIPSSMYSKVFNTIEDCDRDIQIVHDVLDGQTMFLTLDVNEECYADLYLSTCLADLGIPHDMYFSDLTEIIRRVRYRSEHGGAQISNIPWHDVLTTFSSAVLNPEETMTKHLDNESVFSNFDEIDLRNGRIHAAKVIMGIN